MNEIFWPEDYIPGFTDNFVSNEVIVAGLSAMDVWPFLSNAPLWPTYYSNSANIRFYDGKGPELEDNKSPATRLSQSAATAQFVVRDRPARLLTWLVVARRNQLLVHLPGCRSS